MSEEEPVLPDLSLAYERMTRHFDGNSQNNIRLWFWAFVDHLGVEDFEILAQSDALDWVIIPMRHGV